MLFLITIIAVFPSLLIQSTLAAPNHVHTQRSNARATHMHIHTPIPPVISGMLEPSTIGHGAPTPALAFTVASAAVTPKGPAPIGPNPIVLALHTITDASTALKLGIGKVTPQCSVEEITAAAAVTVHSLADIVADIVSTIGVLQKKPMIISAFVDIIVEGLVKFVNAHQALLKTVIGKHSIFAQYALTIPLAAVLRALEAAIDAFASALIRAIPTKKAIIQKEISDLDVTLKASVAVYSQVCRPSPMFPQKQPTCITRSL